MKSSLEIHIEQDLLAHWSREQPQFNAEITAAFDALENTYTVAEIGSKYADIDDGDKQAAAALQATLWKQGEEPKPFSQSLVERFS